MEQQVAHPFDSAKKVVSFDMFSPLSAHHIGFAVGAFVQTPISDLQDEDQDHEQDQDNDKNNKAKDAEADEDENEDTVPISLYTFPHMVSEATNSCMFLYKAMEYFVREYGSYPYTSFSYVFVDDAQSPISSAAGMAICSDKLLFPSEVIEPLFNNTEALTVALSSQWCGVNIVPKTWDDIWVTIAISTYMAQCFIRKLLGNNEYRYRMRCLADEICEQDINKPPLAAPVFNFPITEDDLGFIKLKGPVILFILDRRMTKTDRSFGLSRVIPKLFLQAMSGDLNNSCVSTAQFIRLCERVSHNRLDSFFDQWVFGSGYPIFRVTQRFNKKRMFVEMGIRQVQLQEVPDAPMNEHTFVTDAKIAQNTGRFPVQPIFTGPMTIRIHEADGTPYEHVVDLKENFTKLDIQYNTKYKRLKRKKFGDSNANNATNNTNNSNSNNVENGGNDEDMMEEDGGTADVLLHSLGDVLQTEAEINEWRLTDWSKDEEDRMVNEAFEWIRVDADFEWICKLYINQPDYMFCSQLQQDRDVVAQVDAVRHFGMLRPSALYSSILVRTLMDRRYYYGVRVEAARQLARCATEDVDFIGKFHLMKAFQSMYCFENSTIPMGNDFSDFTSYFVQKTIPAALSQVRDSLGNCPFDVKNFLLDLLRYNDNSNNPFSDCFYVSELIVSIVMSLKRSEDSPPTVDEEIIKFVEKAVAEIDRCCRMDAWLPSVHNMVTTTAIIQKDSLVREGYVPPRFDELIQYTKIGNNNEVRLSAFKSLLGFGGLKNKSILRYFFSTCAYDFSNYVRFGLVGVLQDVIGSIAIKGELKATSYSSSNNSNTSMGVIEGEAVNSRRETLARTTIGGATEMLRKSLDSSVAPGLRKELWTAINDKVHYGVVQRRQLLDICNVLYPPVDSFIVTLPTPRVRKLVAKHLGNGMMVVKRESRVKIQLSTGGGAKKSRKKSSIAPIIISNNTKSGPSITIKNSESETPTPGGTPGPKIKISNGPKEKELPKVKLKMKLS